MQTLPENIPSLTTFYVYLTGGCNLACRHCWLSPAFQPNGGTGGHLDFDLFRLAVAQGLPLGLQSVKLTGGEPLLHPDFTRFVDLIWENQLNLTIETNGTLMTPELARNLKEHSTLSHISVSLDGASADTHDPFRGVKGSFERACQGIRSLVEVGYRPQVIMSLHAGNVGEIEPLVRLAESLGAASVKFNLIQPSGRAETMAARDQVLDINRLVETGRWVEHDLQKQTSLRLHYSWPVAFYSLGHLMNGGSDSCGIFGILGILSSGELALCGIGVDIPELCFGRLGQDPLAEIWTSHPTIQQLRSSLPADLEGICARCLFKQQCLGSCVAENYHLSGRLTAAHWFCQQAEAAGLFPLARAVAPVLQ